MANNENLIPIPGRLHAVTTDGIATGADEIYDDSLQKDQATINTEVQAAIGTGGSVDTKITNAINALDASVSKSAGADGLALSVTEENGKVTAINGSIAANTYDAYGAASAAQSAAISAAATDATTKVNAAKSEIKGTATSACDTLGEAETKINANATAISSLSSGKADKGTTLAGYGITDAYTKSETYTKTEVNGLVDTPHQEYVTVDAYANLPATGSKDTIYRVSNYNGSTSQVDASVYSEYAWNGTQYIFLCVKSQIGEVFDISVYNNNAKYADLAAALNGGANIPQSLQKGGMSVKFVQSSDNKYVQFRLMADSFSADTDLWSFCGDDVLVENPEFVDATTDSEGKLLEARRINGTKVEYCDLEVKGNIINQGIQEQIDSAIEDMQEEVDEMLESAQDTLSFFETTENPEFLDVTTDSEYKVLQGIKSNGMSFVAGDLQIDGNIINRELDTKLTTIDNNLVELNTNVFPLKDKNMGVDGDSITWGNQWSYYASLILGCNHYNVAYSGASWAYKQMLAADGVTMLTPQTYNENDFAGYTSLQEVWASDTDRQKFVNNNACTHIEQFVYNYNKGTYPKPDVFVFALGTNADTGYGNSHGTVHQAMSAASINDVDFVDENQKSLKYTMCGAMRWCVETIWRAFPDCKIFISLPIQRAQYDINETMLFPKVQLIRDMAIQLSCQIIDQYNGCGITSAVENGTGPYLADGLHTNESGRKLMGAFAAKEIRNNYFNNLNI